ncbi:MAG TPA: GHKL domain-containing protein, partial [Candidatus Fimimorpha faecalis]|nr:GHKL domain-containing protein [Candidatus Fimimorpha faecalis]
MKLKSTILQKEIQRELDYYKSLNTQITQMRKIRHDFNNQLQTAYMLLENPNLKISNIPDQSNLRSVFCENKILDFILQSSYSHAKEVGISFNFNVVVPDSIRIEKIDLCSIFSNLLNNAIHAAQKTEN